MRAAQSLLDSDLPMRMLGIASDLKGTALEVLGVNQARIEPKDRQPRRAESRNDGDPSSIGRDS